MGIMFKNLILFAGLLLISVSATQIWAQEPKLAAFQENAQVIFDQQISNNVTAAISLQSSNNQEIRIPTYLINKIQENEKIVAVEVSNEKTCVLGVPPDLGCVKVNISTQGIEGGVPALQAEAKKAGDSVIDQINQAFDINSKYHSAFIHHRDPLNQALETSGVISGIGTISAVYTIPREDSQSMYEKFSAVFLKKEIRDAGGFYDTAKKIAEKEDSIVSVSIFPQKNANLYQLKIAINYPNSANLTNIIDPLKYLNTDELKRSEIFSKDFYPLNSLLQTVIVSPQSIGVKEVNTNLVSAKNMDGVIIPDITTGENGWFFEKKSGNIIDGRYLFGKKDSVIQNELLFSLIPVNETSDENQIVERQLESAEIDSFQIVILVGIVMAAIGATLYYLKGYKKS